MASEFDHCEEFLRRHDLTEPLCGAYFPPGWTKLLDELVTDLKKLGWDGKLEQIKSKLGSLRFYTGGVYRLASETDQEFEKRAGQILDRIDHAERASIGICDKCGEPGKLRVSNSLVVRTRCKEHGDKAAP